MTGESLSATPVVSAQPRNSPVAFGAGAIIGALGGLIGLGGAEFRLPLLIGAFRFAALQAVILNKAMSLVVVASALPFRAAAVPFASVAANWPIIVNLLAGSLLGAWFGAGWATRLASQTLYRVIAILLLVIAVLLVLGHNAATSGAMLTGAPQMVVGVAAGFAIGIVAALLGVAGGELLIPTLVLLFGADIKLAGSLSLAVSLPTMLVGFARYRPGSQLRCARGKSPVRAGDGGRLDPRQLHRGPVARSGSKRPPPAVSGGPPRAVSAQGLETQITMRGC